MAHKVHLHYSSFWCCVFGVAFINERAVSFSSLYMSPICGDSSGDRLGDITFWKGELIDEIRAMDCEIENLTVQLFSFSKYQLVSLLSHARQCLKCTIVTVQRVVLDVANLSVYLFVGFIRDAFTNTCITHVHYIFLREDSTLYLTIWL